MTDLVNLFLTCAARNTEAKNYDLAIGNLQSALYVRGLSDESAHNIIRVLLKLEDAKKAERSRG